MSYTSPSADSESNISQNSQGNYGQTIGKAVGCIILYVSGGQATINPQTSDTITLTGSSSSEIKPNPYKGLLAFREEDKDRFFGRKAEIETLWKQLRDLHETESCIRLLTIYGPSGSGKSSLAQAGLIPKLSEEPLPGQDRARVAVLVPDTNPLMSLAIILARIATNDAAPPEKAQEFVRVLRSKEKDRYEGLKCIVSTLPEINTFPLVIVVDQLEEVFTLCEKQEDCDAFIGNLLFAITGRSKQVSAIITLRSDFIGETKKYPALNELIKPQGFLLKPMTSENLQDAIAKPAILAGSPIDQGTINRLVEQTERREGALPLLQYALEKIWQELRKGNDPEKTLEKIGGVGGALTEGAKRIYEKLASKEQLIARQVFLGLVHLGEGTKDTRRRVEVSRLVSHQNSPEEVLKVIDKFAHTGARLITLAEDDEGERTAEVSHEALFENWQQLEEWIGDRIDLRFQRRLEAAAIVWNEHGKPKTNLWQSPDLDLLRKHQDEFGDDMTTLQIEFFNDSISYENNKEAESEKAEKDKKKQRKIIISGLLFAFGALVIAGNAIYLNIIIYNKYVYCLTIKGRPGERVEGTDTCFRALRTSGDLPVFLSRTNYSLEQGTQAFREKDYERAKSLFNEAAMAEPDDPVSQIFFNNASARLFAKKSHKPIVKLAVVTSVDYFETGARQVLTGVAHAQDKFNCYNEDKRECFNLPNIEIEINNDENEPKAAQSVAATLVNDETIKGVIGHYASESTITAQIEVYGRSDTPLDKIMPVISPTSSSSKISGTQFFRAIGDTKKGAKKYVDYLLENNINSPGMLVIFYNSNAEYSKTLTDDFITKFEEKVKSSKITAIDIISHDKKNINKKIIDNEINKIFRSNRKVRAVLSLTNVKTNSIPISIMKKIKNHKDYKDYLKKSGSIIFFGAMSLLEKEVLKNGDKDIDGLIMARPCMSATFKFGKWKNTKNLPQPGSDMDWRTATSYDTTQAFGEAIKSSRNNESRAGILSQLKSNSFHLTEKETSGVRLQWDLSEGGDRSNKERPYCLVHVQKGKFVPIHRALPIKAQHTQLQ